MPWSETPSLVPVDPRALWQGLERDDDLLEDNRYSASARLRKDDLHIGQEHRVDGVRSTEMRNARQRERRGATSGGPRPTREIPRSKAMAASCPTPC